MAKNVSQSLRRSLKTGSLEGSGRKIIAGNPSDLSKAWSKYYDLLAAHFIERIGRRRFRLILEAGCGKGQLTIPLLRRLPREVRMIAIDSSKGPYAGWLKELSQELRRAGLEKRVRSFRSEARRIRSEERRVGKECRSRWSPDH